MIPVLILAGIDVVLGCAAIWFALSRRYWRSAAWRALRGWQAYIETVKGDARRAAARRSASARHARKCQIEQQRQRKAETTAKLQREAGR